MSKYIVMAAKIVAPRINPSSTEAGFQWCMDEVMRAKLPQFAHGVLMAKAAHFLAAGEMDKAVTVLKQCEKHSGAARTRAATNLSFIYLLEGNVDEAERYGNMAKQNDEYHTQVTSSSSDGNLCLAQISEVLCEILKVTEGFFLHACIICKARAVLCALLSGMVCIMESVLGLTCRRW
jgi:hypothetical protein